MHQKVWQQLLNRRSDSHKYDFGHVLVVGGSPGLVGAPLLAARAALRVGAGLVTIASSKPVIDKLEKRVEEIMTWALPISSAQAAQALNKFIHDRKVSVMVIGPGLQPASAALARQLIKSSSLPMVIDGGALSALAGHLHLLDHLAKSGSAKPVLTPHLGEFQRFCDEPLPKKRTELKPIAAQFAKRGSLILVLKGQPTYVAHPDGSIYENTTGNPGLATAGTGDVLAGVIAGLIAQSLEPGPAAEAGVYLHGLAGDLAAASKTQAGLIASDVIEFLPAALKKVAK